MPSHTVRNAAAYTTAELFWGFAWALCVETSTTAAFSKGFGGSEAFVGTTALVTALALGVPTLFTALWVEPLRHKRGFVFWGHVAGGVVLGAVAAFIGLAGDAGGAAVRVAYLVGMGSFFLSVGLLIPAWLALVGELFPSGKRARVLGITFFVNRVGALVGGEMLHEVLAAHWSPTDQWALLFGVAGAAALVGSLPFLWIVEVPMARPARHTLRSYVRSLFDALRELPMLRRFIWADLFAVTGMVALFFYPDAAIRGEGFPASATGTWVMLAAAAQMAASAVVAFRGDRVRPRTWIALGALSAAACAGFAAVGGSALVYGAAAVLGGFFMGVRMSCHSPLVLDLAPGRDGTAPLGLVVAFIMLVQGVVPYVAGLVIPTAGYGPVFATVALCCLLSAVFVLRGGSGNRVSGPEPA